MTLLKSIQSSSGALPVDNPATGSIIAKVKAYSLDEISDIIGQADQARHD